jgi:hypothetical protein
MSQFEQKAIGRAIRSLSHHGISQPEDWGAACIASLLNMVELSQNMKKRISNDISALPVPVRDKQDWTASLRPQLFPMPFLVWSGNSVHAAAHPACIRFSHV